MKTLLSSMLSLNPSCCSETFCSTSKLNAKEQANMSVHEIWVGPGLTFFYKNLPSLQIFIFSSENGLTTTIRRWQHSAFDLNASACPKRLKSQYRYVLLLHIVLPCICMYCPLNLFEHSDEPRNCSKKQLSGHFSGASSCSLSTASKQAWTPQMKLYHRGTDCQRIPSVSCPSCSTSSGIFMGICASWECGSQKEILIQSSTTSSSVAVFV